MRQFFVNLVSSSAHIVVLTETWLKEGVLSSELFPVWYTVFRSHRTTGRGGGVLIAVLDIFPSQQVALV